jgi:anthranilate/para-aminobenzoate synthase component II
MRLSHQIIKSNKGNLSLMNKIEDMQALINKPVIGRDEKEIGVVSDVQPLHIIVSSGPVTPDKYNIPKEFVSKFENGVIYLSISQKEVADKYEFE